jgi:molecular chaperone GrpE
MTEKPEEKRPEEERPEDGAEPEAAPAGPAESEVDPATERDRLMDRLMRLTAEFDNYRKRMVRERAEWESRAKERLILDILPAVDSFDRALDAASGSTDVAAVHDGMMLVHKQLLDALRGHGIEPFEAIGEPFDPKLHEAFLSRPAEENEKPGTIVEEFATGYRLKDRVIRPTKGVVAAGSPDAAAVESGPVESPEEE